MSRAVERKEYPLSMRLPEADIAIIDRAATLRGRSRTDFVREAAVRAAEDVLMETMPIRMSPTGFKDFMAALSRPATSVPEMVDLFRRPAPWEAGDSCTDSLACDSSVSKAASIPRQRSARTAAVKYSAPIIGGTTPAIVSSSLSAGIGTGGLVRPSPAPGRAHSAVT